MTRLRTLAIAFAAPMLVQSMAVAGDTLATLYRETFPADTSIRTDGGAPPEQGRGARVLSEGWDVIRAFTGTTLPLSDIKTGPTFDTGAVDDMGDPVLLTIGQNSAAIFLDGRLDPGGEFYLLEGSPAIDGLSADGGINNNQVATGGLGVQFLPANGGSRPEDIPAVPGVQNGYLFISTNIAPYLGFTEEVPAGTTASDVDELEFRIRAEVNSSSPVSQQSHAALKVNGEWFVSENFATPTGSDAYYIETVDIEGGNWASLAVSQFAFDEINMIPSSIDDLVLGAFDQAKPSGAVEAWGIYNAAVTSNNRYDYIAFNSVPEPASACLVVFGLAAGALRRRV